MDDGSVANFFNWAQKEPKSGMLPLRVHMKKDALWRSDDFSNNCYYVCGLPASAPPATG